MHLHPWRLSSHVEIWPHKHNGGLKRLSPLATFRIEVAHLHNAALFPQPSGLTLPNISSSFHVLHLLL